MSWGYVAVAAGTVVSGYLQSDATKSAAKEQGSATALAIDEQRRQFDAMQELLRPYSEAGEESLAAQRALIGLAGPEAQDAAIAQLEVSPQFQAMVEQGEEAILQNAAATGGLRGGNTQAALAQFRPQMLSDLVQQQYANLGGITGLGQSSAAMTGAGGMQTAANIGQFATQGGAAQAAARLGQGQIYSNTLGNLVGLVAAREDAPAPSGGGGSGGGGGGILGGLGGAIGGLF
jgi:hypothetical protein